MAQFNCYIENLQLFFLPLLVGDSFPADGKEISISSDLGLESSKLLDKIFFCDSDPVGQDAQLSSISSVVPGERFSLDMSEMPLLFIGIGSDGVEDGSGLVQLNEKLSALRDPGLGVVTSSVS